MQEIKRDRYLNRLLELLGNGRAVQSRIWMKTVFYI